MPSGALRWGLLALVGLLVLVAPNRASLGAHMFLKEAWVGGGTLLLLTLLLVTGKRHLVLPRHWVAACLLVLFLLGVASLAWAEFPGYGAVALLRWLTAGLIGLAVFQLQTDVDRWFLLRGLFAAGVFVAALGSLQHLFALDVFAQARPPAATFANRNMAMQIVVLTWILGPVLMISEQRRGGLRHWCYAVGTALAVAFASYAQTRAAWLAMAGQTVLLLMFLLALRLRREASAPLAGSAARSAPVVRRGPLALMFGLLLLLSNVGPGGFDPISERLATRAATIAAVLVDADASAGFDRFDLWRSTLTMVGEHPVLGVGLGNWQPAHVPLALGRTLNVARAHNDYLQTLAELGPAGLLLLLAVVVWLAWLMLRELLGPEPPSALRFAPLCATAGILAVALVSFPLQLIGPSLLLAILIGLLLRLECDRLQRLSAPHALGRGAQIGVGALAALVLAVNLDWWQALQRLERSLGEARVSEPVDLATRVAHPMYLSFVKTVAQRLQTEAPRRAEMITRGYLALDDGDVIVNNTLALVLIEQRRYAEAEPLIAATRPLEPRGYYRSWDNEQMLAARTEDMDRLAAVLESLEQEPRELLSFAPTTLETMAISAFRLGRGERALALLRENLERHPRHLASHRSLLLMLARGNDVAGITRQIEALPSYGLSRAAIDALTAPFSITPPSEPQ